MDKVSIDNYEEFTKTVIAEYLENGMGAMPKSEFDILMMHLLLTHGELEIKSNHELSILLQTTESRIKRWRYEARLKYPPDEDYVKERVIERVMYGSDFYGTYTGWHIRGDFAKFVNFVKYDVNKVAEKCGWPKFTQKEIDGILGENAKRFIKKPL